MTKSYFLQTIVKAFFLSQYDIVISSSKRSPECQIHLTVCQHKLQLVSSTMPLSQ